MKRPQVLILVAHYAPGFKFGGPTKSIQGIVELLGDEFDFRIITRDRDYGDAKPYASIPSSQWLKNGKALVFYATKQDLTPFAMARLLGSIESQVLYLNSFFDPLFTIQPLLLNALNLTPKRRVLLAPRGEFSEGALALKSFKKRVYLRLTRHINLLADVHWHASTANEWDDIVRELELPTRLMHNAAPLSVAADLSPNVNLDPGTSLEPGLVSDRLRIVFLARIARMKNLLKALQILRNATMPMDFAIYGPIEDVAYWRECEAAIAELPPHVIANYHGAVPPSLVPSIFGNADVLFLPTAGENFGHVIAEALQCGLPVLISDQTPWRNLREAGVGADLPLADPGAFLHWLSEFAALSPATRHEQRRRCVTFANAAIKDSSAVEDNRRMLRALTSGLNSDKGYAPQ